MPRNKKDFLLDPKIITIVAVIAVVAVFYFYQNLEKINSLERKINKMESQIDQAQAENQNLQKQIKNSDDLDYIEKIAREKLGLVKKGEKLFIPVKDEDSKKDKDDNNSLN